MLRRAFLLSITALGLAACSGPAPTKSVLDETSRSNIAITEVSVDVSKIGEKTEGRPVSAERVEELLTAATRQGLLGKGDGDRAVRAHIDLEAANVITAGQSILVGGESTMNGTVALFDARSGEQLMAPAKVTAGGGGWVLGGVFAVASRDEAEVEVAQMAQEMAGRSKILIFGKPAGEEG